MLPDHSITVEGLTLGYSAPEQFDIETYGRTDAQIDIYQTGGAYL
jgi:hypothetical protein